MFLAHVLTELYRLNPINTDNLTSFFLVLADSSEISNTQTFLAVCA